MTAPCLKDENEFPDDVVLQRYLGDAKKSWDVFLQYLGEQHPSFSGEWRYYKDGKNWLYKITKKKKTVCWVSVGQNMFMTTFYFPDRAQEIIMSSELDRTYIDQFVNGKRYGKIRGLTVKIRNPDDLEATRILIGIREKLK